MKISVSRYNAIVSLCIGLASSLLCFIMLTHDGIEWALTKTVICFILTTSIVFLLFESGRVDKIEKENEQLKKQFEKFALESETTSKKDD